MPEDLDRSQPVPLIISLHGGFLWGAAQRDISRWNDAADREGFIVAYPSGAGRASPRRWRGDPDDVEFITRLIDSLVTVNDVDPDRVYADGLSNGGGMVFVLLYTLHGVGHVWPGGGPGPEWLLGTDSRSLDATEVLWDFFKERQRPAAGSSPT